MDRRRSFVERDFNTGESSASGDGEITIFVFDFSGNGVGDFAVFLVLLDLDEFGIAEFCRENSLPSPPLLSDDDLDRVRQKRGELFARWDAVTPGDALELPFTPAD